MPVSREMLILETISVYLEDMHYAISVRDLGMACDMSIGNLHKVLVEMRGRGLVDWADGDRRTLHLTVLGKRVLQQLEDMP